MPLLRFIPETTNVNFVKYRFVAFAIDGLLMVVSVISILWHGFNLGIDFTGGVLMEVKAAQVIDIGKMRADIGSLGFRESQLQYFGGGECDKPVNSCVMIRVQPKDRHGGRRPERRRPGGGQRHQGQAGTSLSVSPHRSGGPQGLGRTAE